MTRKIWKTQSLFSVNTIRDRVVAVRTWDQALEVYTWDLAFVGELSPDGTEFYDTEEKQAYATADIRKVF